VSASYSYTTKGIRSSVTENGVKAEYIFDAMTPSGIVVHAQSLVAPWWSVQRSYDLHEEFTLKPVTPNEYEYEVRFNPPVPGSTSSTGRLIRP
jgi:hypothetical protein